jgi:hypothetical protein
MRLLGSLTIAAAVAISTFSIPTTSQGIECRQLCYGIYPPKSLLESGDARDECQRRINDSGGTCTINGKMNRGLDMPPGVGYRRQDYRDPRKWDYDHGLF